MFPWTESAKPLPTDRTPIVWVRVNRNKVCPLCGKDSWCTVGNGGELVCCMRVSEGSFKTVQQDHGVAYLHRNGFHDAKPMIVIPAAKERFKMDFDGMLARWETTPAALRSFSKSLGVDVSSLKQLGARWCDEKTAWAFPMHDERRRVIGVRFRTEDGNKFAASGSRSGAFIPSGLDAESTLYICEGPTDTAAALSIGLQAVGRPSCTGATDIIAAMLQAGKRRKVVIVADNDKPGLAGANLLRERIVGVVASCVVITAAPHKDLRAWVGAGGSEVDVVARTI